MYNAQVTITKYMYTANAPYKIVTVSKATIYSYLDDRIHLKRSAPYSAAICLICALSTSGVTK